jgi:hypothetical protein
MLEWYTKKDSKAAKLIGDAGENHKLTSHEIQLDLCKACAQETTKDIIEDIGDSKISFLLMSPEMHILRRKWACV